MTPSRRDLWFAAVLALLTFLAYHATFQNGFVNFDDDRYVTQNPIVQQGLTPSGIAYAFTTFDTGNWIPLTWLSLELDASLGGTAFVYHSTSFLLHLGNVLLLYGVLRRIPLSGESSVLIAALFAIHPTHVESVAWISERKDVLSTFLLLIATLLYQAQLRKPQLAFQLGVAGAFAAGLLAKPMLVTFPVLLLLLDLWVFRRWNGRWSSSPMARTCEPESVQSADVTFSLLSLVREKWLLFSFSIVIGIVTIVAQQNESTMATTAAVPFSIRFVNAIDSLAWYVGKTLLPTGLCIFVPLEPEDRAGGGFLFSLSVVAVLTLTAYVNRKDRPWLMAGWLWFVVSLLPVIGILQVGSQARADRYLYFPQWGLLVMLVLSLRELMAKFRVPPVPRRILAGCWLGVLIWMCHLQTTTWRNSETLWNHALTVIPGNWMAQFQLGRECLFRNDFDRAMDWGRKSIESAPERPEGYSLLGRVQQSQGNWTSAERNYEKVLELQPWNRDGQLGMAAVYYARGNMQCAVQILEQCLSKRPRDQYARLQLGMLFAEQRQPDRALAEFEEVLKRNPRDASVWALAGNVLARAGQSARARDYFEKGLQLQPDNAEIQASLQRLR